MMFSLSFVVGRGGPKSASGFGPGGPYPLADLNRGVQIQGGPNPLGHRCWVPKEVYGRGKGRVKSIPKADWGIGKRVPQTVRKTSGKFIIPPCAKLRAPSDLGLDWELVNTPPFSTQQPAFNCYAATETTICGHKSDIFKYCQFNINKNLHTG